MKTQGTKSTNRVIDRYYRCFNDGDLDGVIALFADDYLGQWGLGSGAETVRRQLAMWYRAVPDISAEVTQTVIQSAGDGEWVASFTVTRGTQTGDLIGLPGSGKGFQMGGVDLFLVREGRIVEGRTVCDFGSVLIAAGAVPALARSNS